MNKLYIRADLYNELIEKGYGKRDLSKLTRKVITDKNGHRRTVFVRNEVKMPSKRMIKKQQDAFMESGKSKVIEAMKNVLGTDNVKIDAFRAFDDSTHFVAMVNYDEVKDNLKNDSAKNELAKELTKLGLKPDETFENVHEARWEYSKRIPKMYKFNFYIKDENMKIEPKKKSKDMETMIYEDMKQHVSGYETDDLMSKRVNNMNTIDKYEKMFSKMSANGIDAKKDRPDLYEIYAAAKGNLRAINEELKARDKQRLENAKKEDSKTSKTYWIQDFIGNRITNVEAKDKLKGIEDKLKYMDSMKEGRTKDIVVIIDAKKRQLENYRDDLISKLNPEDRKEFR